MTDFQNVTPMHPSPGDLKPRARALHDAFRPAGDLEPVLTNNYLVKSWLYPNSISVNYGPSNVGKTFLALNWAHHVSKGLPWAGRRVVRSRVLYLAIEGGAASRTALALWINPRLE